MSTRRYASNVNLTSILDVIFITLFLIILQIDTNVEAQQKDLESRAERAEGTLTAIPTEPPLESTPVPVGIVETVSVLNETATSIAKTATALPIAEMTADALQTRAVDQINDINATAAALDLTATAVSTSVDKHDATRTRIVRDANSLRKTATAVAQTVTAVPIAMETARIAQKRFNDQLIALEVVEGDPFIAAAIAELVLDVETRNFVVLELLPIPNSGDKEISTLLLNKSDRTCEISDSPTTIDDCLRSVTKRTDEIIYVILVRSCQSNASHFDRIETYLRDKEFQVSASNRAGSKEEDCNEVEQ